MTLCEDFLRIGFEIKDGALYYHGIIYEEYNLFLVIENEKTKNRENFQITFSDIQREPLGRFSGSIRLKKGKNRVTILVKDLENREVCSEQRIFSL